MSVWAWICHSTCVEAEGNLLELVLSFHSVVTEFRFNGMAADLRPAQVLL